jgi:hypothetical protein
MLIAHRLLGDIIIISRINFGILFHVLIMNLKEKMRFISDHIAKKCLMSRGVMLTINVLLFCLIVMTIKIKFGSLRRLDLDNQKLIFIKYFITFIIFIIYYRFK